MLGVELLGVRLYDRIAIQLCISLVLVLGLQVFMGNSGILSFAHIGFMGIGAYTSAVLTIPAQMKGMALPDLYPFLQDVALSPYLGIAAGGLVAGAVAAVVSYPLMRLSDAAAVITSFGLLVVIYTVHDALERDDQRAAHAVRPAARPPTCRSPPASRWAPSSARSPSRNRGPAVLLRASRDDEVAAAALGAHIPACAGAPSSSPRCFAGIGGGLWGHFITSFSPKAFYLKETFVILGMLVIGGANTVTGAVVGTFIVTVAFEGLRGGRSEPERGRAISPSRSSALTEIVLALAMIAVLVCAPAASSPRARSARCSPAAARSRRTRHELEDRLPLLLLRQRRGARRHPARPEDHGAARHRRPEHLPRSRRTRRRKRRAGSRSTSACASTVIPNTARLIGDAGRRGVEVIFARIGCHKLDGRDRSLSQKKPGFNYLLIPKDSPEGQDRARSSRRRATTSS